MGPFLVAVRQLKFLVVSIDYFTKWVEVEALEEYSKFCLEEYHMQVQDT